MPFFQKYKKISSAIERFRSKDNIVVKIMLGLATIAAVALMFPRGEAIEHEVNVGGIWVEKDLIAPFAFPIYKDELLYETEKREAAARVYAVFERSDRVTVAQRESLVVAIGRLSSSGDTRRLRLRRNQLVKIFDEVMKAGIIDQAKSQYTHKVFALRKGTVESVTPLDAVYDIPSALVYIEKQLLTMFEESGVTRALEIYQGVLQPNVIYSHTETEKLRQVAMESVPRTIGFVQENERIVGKHERITEEVKLKLDSLRRVRAERGAEHTHTWQYVGIAIHVALITTLYGIYIFLFRKKIFHDNRKLSLIALLLVMESFFAFVSLEVEIQAPIHYLIFISAASMLLTIVFDSRVAFYGTVTMAFLIAGIRGNDYSIALASLVAGALSVYTVQDIKHRTQIFRSLLFIFVGYACVIVALGLERFTDVGTVITELTFALANAVFSPVLTYGLLIFFERAFRVTTDLTLLELADFNSPLLRQLSEKAPGTFHHSLTLGNLAEAAAEAIGANAILARVGAYYHDIGKLLKPEYFVENQQQMKNKHGRLRPRMSALIIASHVKEGIELGRQHGLPDVVLDFVPQHHGTTLISFFYDKALKQSRQLQGGSSESQQNAKGDVHEADYRYPGPKPQTKETGIVMLADAVEATTRAMDDPTSQKLEATIDSMIKARFADGQLDECELTLRDLSKIKEAFLKILIGIHHPRIKYPEPQKENIPRKREEKIVYEQSTTVEPHTVQQNNSNTPQPSRSHEPRTNAPGISKSTPRP